MRPMTALRTYQPIRENGASRTQSFLLATGLWCAWPFRWMFPEVPDHRPAIREFLADAYYSHEITPSDYDFLSKKAEVWR